MGATTEPVETIVGRDKSDLRGVEEHLSSAMERAKETKEQSLVVRKNACWQMQLWNSRKG